MVWFVYMVEYDCLRGLKHFPVNEDITLIAQNYTDNIKTIYHMLQVFMLNAKLILYSSSEHISGIQGSRKSMSMDSDGVFMGAE